MRTVQTFVLRLIVDADEPGVLRGVIRYVATGQERQFANRQELLRLLGEISHPAVEPDGIEDAGISLEGKNDHGTDPATYATS